MRLIFIANSCVSLAGPALTLALSTILSTTLDTGLYQTTYAQYLQLATAIEAGEVTDAAAKDWHAGFVAKEGKMAAAMDTQWIARTKSEAGKLIDKLEVELKGYTTNLIKESIRVSLIRTDEDSKLMMGGCRWDTGTWRGVYIVRVTCQVLFVRTPRDESTAPPARTFSRCAWESLR